MRWQRWFRFAVCALVATTPARAQSEPRLVAAVRLAQDGLTDSARAVVRRILAATEPADPGYPEMLYTSGVIAGTERERRIALRRVVVEYAASDWADDALLLLAQLDYASGNPGGAVTQAARLLADYPGSPLTLTAALWGARAASDLHDGSEACRIADIGLRAPGADVEARNQLEYQKQRCVALIAQTADSAARGPASKPDSAAAAPAQPAPSRGPRVQVIAAPTKAKADQTVAALKRIGITAVVVKESAFYKVRTIPYPTRAAAQAAIARIRAKLGAKPFLVPEK